ncbi:MAG: O-antigen ligase family protein [Desulfuromonadales bacterium]
MKSIMEHLSHNKEHQNGFWHVTVFLVIVLIMLAFSSDLRIGLNLQLNARPDFQFFELVCIPFSVILIFCSPWLILKGRVVLENTDHLLVFFLINAFVLALCAEDVLHNISRTKDFFWAFSLYFLLRYGPLNRRAISVIVRLSVLIAFAWSLLGIIQLLGWDERLGGEAYPLFLASQALYKTVVDPFSSEVVQANFAHGFYLYPQNFIYYLLCPFLLSLGLAQRDRRWLIPALVIFAAVLGTLSKTFVLLLVIFVCLYALQRFFHNPAVTFSIFAALAGTAVLAVVLFGNYPFWKRALETFIWRMELWSDALSMLQGKPWLLVTGDGTAFLESTYSRAGYPNPHNMFIYLLVEYGVAGAGFFFTFLLLRLQRIRAALEDGGALQPVAKSLYWGLLLFVWMGVVDDMFVQTQITALVFFYLGLLTRLIEQGDKEFVEAAVSSVYLPRKKNEKYF